MHKVTKLMLLVVVVAVASSQAARRSPTDKRQIFDTIDLNDYKNARLPARQNAIFSSAKGSRQNRPLGSTSPNSYLPPTTKPPPKRPSTPGPKYLIPTRKPYTTISTTYRSLGTFPPYTGTFPTYRSTFYNYTYTGTYPPIPTTMRPLTTLSTTTFGYEYEKPSNNYFDKEEVKTK